ncbi:MAG: hypothetical protein CO132_03695 [Candidatus Kerfeldbacteria bacterium CG_4_9_14_3_um_filter_45_8]|nr:MAG: hypothetical protein CO132_03695 [Candidatus Kerfeldbacteria bacterium CG_4_9_14_3_um_filter_45_8]
MPRLLQSQEYRDAVRTGAISARMESDYRELPSRRALELFLQRCYHDLTRGDMGRGAPQEEIWYKMMAQLCRLCLEAELISEVDLRGMRSAVQPAHARPGIMTPGAIGTPSGINTPHQPRNDPASGDFWRYLQAGVFMTSLARNQGLSLVLGQTSRPPT